MSAGGGKPIRELACDTRIPTAPIQLSASGLGAVV